MGAFRQPEMMTLIPLARKQCVRKNSYEFQMIRKQLKMLFHFVFLLLIVFQAFNFPDLNAKLLKFTNSILPATSGTLGNNMSQALI